MSERLERSKSNENRLGVLAVVPEMVRVLRCRVLRVRDNRIAHNRFGGAWSRVECGAIGWCCGVYVPLPAGEQ